MTTRVLFALSLIVFLFSAASGERQQRPKLARNYTPAFSEEEVDQSVAFFKGVQIQWPRMVEDVRAVKTLMQPDGSSTLDTTVTRAVLRDLTALRQERDDMRKTIAALEMRLRDLEARLTK